ncbi:MAG TPA: polymer-forming cytoskeletal protein [Thermoanaerobaculia bacterium]|nr:polymer-forming cytoskeletal protein [Thermoanaerobaculia bacterium]HXK69127.1 polymer-forming cytoskeletal protein [Thermoanaerobaculia bacterium]
MGLFGKETKEPVPQRLTPNQSPQPAAKLTAKSGAHIGPQTHVEGTLSTRDDLTITGSFQGEVLSDATVFVEEGGEVKAGIKARRIVISGKVKGKMEAVDAVELKPQGVLEGDIRSPQVIIAEGALFRGSVDMKVTDKKEDKPKTAEKDRPLEKEPAEEKPAEEKEPNKDSKSSGKHHKG